MNSQNSRGQKPRGLTVPLCKPSAIHRHRKRARHRRRRRAAAHRPAGRGARLRAVFFDALVSRLRRDVETALREGRLGYEESGRLLKSYEEGLHGYTYLEDVHEQ